MERREIRPEEREALQLFLRLEITLDELYGRTDGMIHLDFGETERRFTSNFLVVDPGITVGRPDVRRAFQFRREGTLTEADLIRWATMLIMNDAYVWDEDDEEIPNTLSELSVGGTRHYTAGHTL